MSLLLQLHDVSMHWHSFTFYGFLLILIELYFSISWMLCHVIIWWILSANQLFLSLYSPLRSQARTWAFMKGYGLEAHNHLRDMTQEKRSIPASHFSWEELPFTCHEAQEEDQPSTWYKGSMDLMVKILMKRHTIRCERWSNWEINKVTWRSKGNHIGIKEEQLLISWSTSREREDRDRERGTILHKVYWT